MCVQPISAISFRAGKIELDEIHKRDLSNYDSIKMLARKNYCDVLIEKRCNKATPDYNVYTILARRKWINPQYIFGQEITSARKNAPIEEITQKIYEATIKAASLTTQKTQELARAFIR